MLPQSVVERVKSPYPSTQDPHYVAALQRQARELLEQSEDGVLDLVDRGWLERATRPGRRDRLTRPARARMDAEPRGWLDLYHPRVVL